MRSSPNEGYLDFKAIVTILLLTLIWGFNNTAIKISNQGVSPIFASTLRSAIASICGILYCMRKGQRLFHTDIMLFHGVVVGLLFGLEFACIYFGLLFTDAARAVLFLYFSPFVVAVGAHLFLKGDRLTLSKSLGLGLAFLGILIVFRGRPKTAKSIMIAGDVLQILAAFFWGATSVYIKKFMAERVHPINTFLYQLFFSIPILFIISLVLEPKWICRMDLPVTLSLIHQSLIVAFVTYFVWFNLLYRYSASRLSAFTFFTPIFGVLSGIIFLGEEFTVSLMVGLPLVCLGIFLVNWRGARSQESAG